MNNFLGDKVECELYLDFINYSVLLPMCILFCFRIVL